MPGIVLLRVLNALPGSSGDRIRNSFGVRIIVYTVPGTPRTDAKGEVRFRFVPLLVRFVRWAHGNAEDSLEPIEFAHGPAEVDASGLAVFEPNENAA